jgi:WXG100 family type VII secretion target
MADIKYSPTTVRKAGRDFTTVARDIDRKMQNLQGQVNSMRWQSAPATAFRNRFETEWRTGLQQLSKALDDTGRALTQVASTYSDADTEMEASVRKVMPNFLKESDHPPFVSLPGAGLSDGSSAGSTDARGGAGNGTTGPTDNTTPTMTAPTTADSSGSGVGDAVLDIAKLLGVTAAVAAAVNAAIDYVVATSGALTVEKLAEYLAQKGINVSQEKLKELVDLHNSAGGQPGSEGGLAGDGPPSGAPSNGTGSTTGQPGDGTGSTTGQAGDGTGSTTGQASDGTGSTTGQAGDGTGSTTGQAGDGTGSTTGQASDGTGSTTGQASDGTGSTTGQAGDGTGTSTGTAGDGTGTPASQSGDGNATGDGQITDQGITHDGRVGDGLTGAGGGNSDSTSSDGPGASGGSTGEGTGAGSEPMPEPTGSSAGWPPDSADTGAGEPPDQPSSPIDWLSGDDEPAEPGEPPVGGMDEAPPAAAGISDDPTGTLGDGLKLLDELHPGDGLPPELANTGNSLSRDELVQLLNENDGHLTKDQLRDNFRTVLDVLRDKDALDPDIRRRLAPDTGTFIHNVIKGEYRDILAHGGALENGGQIILADSRIPTGPNTYVIPDAVIVKDGHVAILDWMSKMDPGHYFDGIREYVPAVQNWLSSKSDAELIRLGLDPSHRGSFEIDYQEGWYGNPN